MTTLQPLDEMPAKTRRNLAVVLTDIDDTLTKHGRLPAKAYSALERLKLAGFIVAPITGRPAGWCDLIARQWPVDGVVGENGAFYFRHDDASAATHPPFRQERPRTDARYRQRSTRFAVRCSPRFRERPSPPTNRIREADLAIDFCEDVPPLPRSEVLKIVAIFERFGATAKISLHPRQRLVRRLRQAFDHAALPRRLLRLRH